MTTIVVVKKGGIAVIGADTLVTYGDQLESADYIRNASKLIPVDDTWLAATGHAAVDLVLRRLFDEVDPEEGEPVCAQDFSGVDAIFTTFVDVHQNLKKSYFLRTDEDKDEDFESMHMHVLLANPHGIFGVCSRRSVFEYTRFYAYGSGEQYALGAMHSLYDRLDDPVDIATAALEAAATFDVSTGGPFELKTIALSPSD